jgi:hypothetical protein
VDAAQGAPVYARWAHAAAQALRPQPGGHRRRRGGLVTAYIAAAVKAKVTLVEAHKMGGDCLNYGCVPSKALIKTATLAHQMRHSADYGVAQASRTLRLRAGDGARVPAVVRDIEPHDSVERYTGLGVDVLQGTRASSTPGTWRSRCRRQVQQTLTTRSIVIATGARPFVPPLPGLDDVGYLTSDTLWDACANCPAPGGAGRRAHRLRAGAELCAPGLAGHAGGDGAAHDGARGRRRVGLAQRQRCRPTACRC